MLTFPQEWSGGSLSARLLLLPASDPTTPPLGTGLPKFSGSSWPVRVTALTDPDALLGPSPASSPGAKSFAFTATPPAGAAALFDGLADVYAPKAPDLPANRSAQLGSANVRKYLPESYTRAIPFERPAPGTVVGNEFACGLREPTWGALKDPKPPATVTWGALISFALRQPALARALGLLYDIPLPGNFPGPLDAGGWLYVDLDPASGVVPTPPEAIRSYAARLPVLALGAQRSVFAAVLFPVGLTGAGSYDEALREAAGYDDGFAKIVHAAQAETADAASSGHNELRPATDAGIDIGWDDEQVTLWLNRQLDGLRSRLSGTSTVEAPLGVAGYRIDVSQPEIPALSGWSSLCRAFSVNVAGNAAPLQFPSAPAVPLFTSTFDDELSVEPTPCRSMHDSGKGMWLPQYFARWQGGSVVASDPTLFQLTGATPSDADGNPIAVPPPTYLAKPPLSQLRYGRLYRFRCRLSDLTGGGPAVDDPQSNPAPHPVTEVRFVRKVPPKLLHVKTNIAVATPGKPTPAVSTIETIDVWRPLIGYPEMVFAGLDDPVLVASLLARAASARAAGSAVGVNDPDVTSVRILVEVRANPHDPGPEGGRDGDFRELYSIETPFGPFDADNVLDAGAPLHLSLAYLDSPDVADFVAPADGATEIPLPRGRDVRIRLTGTCSDKPNYFGAPWVQEGLTSDLFTRAEAVNEDNLYVPQEKVSEARGIFLQPVPDALARLANELGIVFSGMRLSGRPGERTVFGCSAALRCSLGADRGAIEFSSSAEIIGRWIVALEFRLSRDWTWDALQDIGFLVSRRDDPASAFQVIGNSTLPFVVSPSAVPTSPPVGDDPRAKTRFLFFDAIDPAPPSGKFPSVLTPEWQIEPQIKGFSDVQNEALVRSAKLRLPVATRPAQTPKLVAAGVALSPYEANEDYSETKTRNRSLWFEFEEPVADPNDTLYARILSYGPDPLLSGDITHLLRPVPSLPFGSLTLFDIVERALPQPADPPPLAIDPEPIRIITPDQPEDDSGINAMNEMTEAQTDVPNTRSKYFIVPLPDGTDGDSPELFGFWGYEIRVGHKLIWSTAQARYGRPLVIKGVQHPAPILECAPVRLRGNPPGKSDGIVVTVPFATAVFADKRLTRLAAGDPRTKIWVMLYAQVRQADGTMNRNILIARALAFPQRTSDTAGNVVPPATRDVLGVARFDQSAINKTLDDLALPVSQPLSALAVELLPGDNLVQIPTQLPTFGIAETQVEEVFTLIDKQVPDASSGQTLASFSAPASDPLGRDLGSMDSRRILRCSRLTPVAPAC